jgi:hypothetical protein
MTKRPYHPSIHLDVLLEVSLGSPIGQFHAMPVALGPGAPKAFLGVYCADFDDDPYVEMFFFPTDTRKMILVTAKGKALWRRDLGPGVVPGVWFCPVYPFDLDGDGVDEIWYVNNVNVDHPLGLSGYRLERVDARTGETTGQWPWPAVDRDQALSHVFRNFIVGGYVHNQPVLVTAQGTYGDMAIQGWRPDMSQRWEHKVAKADPGARGSHMCPITDLDGDGVQELMWGERCIELDTGSELFCADRDTYRGHSDVVIPVQDRASGRWLLYTCRESDGGVSPRVALYDQRGQRVWGHVDHGHMDMGWIARLGENRAPVAMAIRIGHKTCGPDGRFHFDTDEFVWDALTGEPYDLPFGVYGTLPVDLNGDGYHELVYGIPGQDGTIIDRHGAKLGSVGGPVAMLSKFLDHPGEQIVAYYADGTVRVWGDRSAADSPEAIIRFEHPLYRINQRLGGVGYNVHVLGGL